MTSSTDQPEPIDQPAEEEEVPLYEHHFRLHFHDEQVPRVPLFAHQVIDDSFPNKDTLFSGDEFVVPDGAPTEEPVRVDIKYSASLKAYVSCTVPSILPDLVKTLPFPPNGDTTCNKEEFEKWDGRSLFSNLPATCGCSKVASGEIQLDGKVHDVTTWKLDLANEQSRSLFVRLQCVCVWFIETASLVDVDDENSRWTVLVMTQTERGADTPPSIVGFCSLYEFSNPFHAGQPRILRICQFLVFPRYQGKRCASMLLNAAYKESAKEDVYEITVETPNDKFVKLRDAVDCANMLDCEHVDLKGWIQSASARAPPSTRPPETATSAPSNTRTKPTPNSQGASDPVSAEASADPTREAPQSSIPHDSDPSTAILANALSKKGEHPTSKPDTDANVSMDVLPQELSDALHKHLKITHKQIQKCYEIIRFTTLLKVEEPQKKQFRLGLKRRLYKEFADAFVDVKDKQQVKTALAAMYSQVTEGYEQVAKRIKL